MRYSLLIKAPGMEPSDVLALVFTKLPPREGQLAFRECKVLTGGIVRVDIELDVYQISAMYRWFAQGDWSATSKTPAPSGTLLLFTEVPVKEDTDAP